MNIVSLYYFVLYLTLPPPLLKYIYRGKKLGRIKNDTSNLYIDKFSLSYFLDRHPFLF